MSFYRIYRPQTIDEIDNQSVQKQLETLLTKKIADLPHAYLFYGPRGAGKTTAARVVAKIFNCTHRGPDGKPCGTCEQCSSIAKGTNMDVVELDAASNRGIDEIRKLRDQIGYTPSKAAYTVYIIDEVHMLTTEAFNALLKTLEEPPAHAIFILATTELSKVLPTIRSRATTIAFPQAEIPELLKALRRITQKESIDIDDNALKKIAELADGSFRDAVKYLEQVSLTKGTITESVISERLSLSDSAQIDVFVDAFRTKNTQQALEILIKGEQKGNDPKLFIKDTLKALEILLVSSIRDNDDTDFPSDSLRECITLLTQAWVSMKTGPIPLLPVEVAIVTYMQQVQPASPTEIAHSETHKPASPAVVPQTEAHEPASPAVVPPSGTKEGNPQPTTHEPDAPIGTLTMDKLVDCWKDVIEAFKEYNHSIAGVLRSARPKSVENGTVTIEAFYPFHKDKLSEPKTKEIMTTVFRKLFGEKVRIDVIVGKK